MVVLTLGWAREHLGSLAEPQCPGAPQRRCGGRRGGERTVSTLQPAESRGPGRPPSLQSSWPLPFPLPDSQLPTWVQSLPEGRPGVRR